MANGNTVKVRTGGNVESFTTGAGVPHPYTITNDPEGTDIPKADLEAVQKEAAENGVTIIDVTEEASASG